jgi:hypothetical protein
MAPKTPSDTSLVPASVSSGTTDIVPLVDESGDTWYPVPDIDREGRARLPLIKWGAVPIGTTLKGIARGTERSDFGAHGLIEVAPGIVQPFTLPLLLARRWASIEDGRRCRIVYLGMVEPKGDGKPYHLHDVFSDRPVFLPNPPPDPDTDDVPF